MIPWTIKGESGKTFNATVRSLETAQIDSAQISFRSLEADTFTFTISPETLTSATIPDLEQKITLYRDGVQFFTGTVTNVRPIISQSSQQAQVTVSGPWWWMERINMTTVRTDGAGSTGERMTFVFGNATTGGDLETHIRSLIARAIALGVPMQLGGVADFFNVPQISLNQSTVGQALSELVRLVPDTQVNFDYSTTPPTIDIRRRGTSTARTIDVATAPVDSIDIEPMIELQVSQVRLPYVTRDVQGRTVYQEQASGTAATGKVEILTVSGPELDTFLPNELFDSYSIRTSTIASATNFVLNQDGSLVQLAKESGYSNGRLPLTIQTLGGVSLWISQSSSIATPPAGTYQNSLAIPPPSLTSINGTAYSTSTYKVITTADAPDWVISELGLGIKEVTFEGYLGATHIYRTEYGAPTIPLPTWWNSVGFDLQIDGFTFPTSNGSRLVYGFKKFSVKCLITTTAYTSATTVYRPADYSFIQPPANLAANLKAAQDWLPYTGSITLVEEDVGGTRYMGTKISLTNTLPAYASMNALVAGVNLDIATGTTTIELGQPPRLDYRTFVDRIRKTSQDNIVYL